MGAAWKRGQRVRGARQGFTLIEILMVVVILGIASLVIVPQIGGRDDLKAGAAARVLMADLIYAQNRAITYQRNHYLVFEPESGRYTLQMREEGEMKTLAHPIEKTDYVMRFGAGGTAGLAEAQLETADFVGRSTSLSHTLGFDELGGPLVYSEGKPADAMTDGSVVVRCGAHRLRVSVEPYTGQISVAAVE